MAFHLSVALRCQSDELATTLANFLVRETRPIFEDEVDERVRPLFLAVEDLEYPHEMKASGRQVVVHWFEEDGLSFEDLKALLSCEGIELVAAYEVPDDPMELDEEEDSWFWLPKGRNVFQTSLESAKVALPAQLIETLLQ